MTSLISWIGIDQRGPASAYFASDSRITWGGKNGWEHGRKLFASSKYPHILGYCGDVLFPTQTLSQVIEMIDAGLLLDNSDTIDVSVEKMVSVISSAFDTYPSTAKKRFEVLYCFREGDGVSALFHLRHIVFDPIQAPRVSIINLPAHSDIVANLGTGAVSMRASLEPWKASEVGGTSRAVFSAFSDSLRSGIDRNSAGPPQLVGLQRRFAAKTFGIVWEQRRYFYGLEVDLVTSSTDVRWFNDRLEICDPQTMSRRIDAQPQPRPRGL